MNKKLPPLNALITFEAAARLNSFKLAAIELHQTPAAVAYQIRKLESSLTVELFDRQHRGVTLNNAGRLYFTTIAELLTELANQTRQFKAIHAQLSLRVLTLHAIAEKWLMPRLAHFRENHADINIEINATEDLVTTTSSDIVIGFSLKEPKNPSTTVLLEEDIFPVCARDYLKNPEIELEDNTLAYYDLLFDVHWKQDWQLWLQQNGFSAKLNHKPGYSFSLYSMVIEAAVNGMGIMMGHKQLINKELQNGTLISVFKKSRPVKGYYYLTKNELLPDNCVADHFQSWIMNQVQS